jgi:hypothetical protein
MAGATHIASLALHSYLGRKEGLSNPFGSDFYVDLLKMHGLSPDGDALDQKMVTFEDLADPLMGTLLKTERSPAAPSAAGEFDLLILAHYTPNSVPYNSTTSFLMYRHQLNCFAFAVSDQQTAVGLTALKIAHDFLRSGRYRRALVLFLDQSSLPRQVDWMRSREILDSAAGVILETAPEGGGLEIAGYDSRRMAPDTTLPEALAAAFAEPKDSLFLVDPSVYPYRPPPIAPENWRMAPANHLVTGSWFALHALLRSEPELNRPVVLVDCSLENLTWLRLNSAAPAIHLPDEVIS